MYIICINSISSSSHLWSILCTIISCKLLFPPHCWSNTNFNINHFVKAQTGFHLYTFKWPHTPWKQILLTVTIHMDIYTWTMIYYLRRFKYDLTRNSIHVKCTKTQAFILETYTLGCHTSKLWSSLRYPPCQRTIITKL